MEFHIYRASNWKTKGVNPGIDDDEFIAEFKDNPPCESAVIKQGLNDLEWDTLYWSVDIETIDQALAIFDHLVFKSMNHEIKGLRTMIIYDGYIE